MKVPKGGINITTPDTFMYCTFLKGHSLCGNQGQSSTPHIAQYHITEFISTGEAKEVRVQRSPQTPGETQGLSIL